MRHIKLCTSIAATGVGLLVAGAPARATAGDQRTVALTGSCTTLSYQGKDKAADCSGKLTVTEFGDGRRDFLFRTTDGLAVTFEGIGPSQATSDDSSVVQPLDAVIIAKNNRSDRAHATGSCRLTGLGRGAAPVICEAASSIGVFRATFVFSGKPALRTPM